MARQKPRAWKRQYPCANPGERTECGKLFYTPQSVAEHNTRVHASTKRPSRTRVAAPVKPVLDVEALATAIGTAVAQAIVKALAS